MAVRIACAYPAELSGLFKRMYATERCPSDAAAFYVSGDSSGVEAADRAAATACAAAKAQTAANQKC